MSYEFLRVVKFGLVFFCLRILWLKLYICEKVVKVRGLSLWVWNRMKLRGFYDGW